MTDSHGQGEGPDANPAIANPPTNISTDLARRRAAERRDNDGDGGGGGAGTLEVRVAHLETRMDRLETKIDTVIDRIGAVATKSETRGYLLLGIATFVAIIGLLITGMGWLETRASRVDARSSSAAPIVIQMPSPVSSGKPHT